MEWENGSRLISLPDSHEGVVGFTPIPAVYAPIVVALVATYLVLVEQTKRHLFHPEDIRQGVAQRATTKTHRLRRRAARFSAKLPRIRHPRLNP